MYGVQVLCQVYESAWRGVYAGSLSIDHVIVIARTHDEVSTQLHLILITDSARDLGVSYLTMAPHVSAVCRATYYQLWQLRPLMRSLSFDAAKLLVQAFISTRLDYCNSLMYGISDNLDRRLQAVQNATARLITSTRRCEQLHWLPVRQHVHFKLAVLAYKTLHDRLPSYLAEDCQLVAFVGHRHVSSSANQHTVWWSLVCRCGATNWEQSANPIARLRTITRTIQAVTQDTSLQAYIRLLTAAAQSDSVLRALGTNWLTSLLTICKQNMQTCFFDW